MATETTNTETTTTGTTGSEAAKTPAETLFGGTEGSRDTQTGENKGAEGENKGAVEQTPEQKAEAEKTAAAEKLTTDVKALTDAGFKKNDGETDEQFAERAGKEKAEKDKAAREELRGAPETYDVDKFTVPEGMVLDKDKLAANLPVFKELDLSQKGAQKLIDIYARAEQDKAKQSVEAWDKQVADWKKQSTDDKEIGGKALEESVGYAKEALKQFGTPELAAAAELYSWGDHPEFIRAWARVGKAISEAKLRTGKAPEGEKQSQAKVMFPNMN